LLPLILRVIGIYSSNGKNKSNHINQIIRDERIGILAVGEAHLNVERCNNISQIFGRIPCQ
jgi:hypothetical protein